jgi:pimeloyl-ACP methyl ester carboxylesterase
MSPSERDVHLSDGRTLRVLEDGDPHGRPVFYFHGTPGSRLLFEKSVQHAKAHGIRLIGHDRPGYGGSTPKPGRRIVDEAADVAAIADALGLDRFAVLGHSGGGPPTLACAAALPKRLVAAASLASPAPYPAEGMDWLAGMGELNVADFTLMMSDQPAWEAKTAEDNAMMMNATPEQMRAYMSSLISDVDSAALTEELAGFLLRQFREGIKSGIAGPRDDTLAQVKPWGFELSAIRVPLQLWHGKLDQFVPFSHGQWLAAHLPRAEIHLEPKDGHISLVGRYPSITEWLVSHF